MSVTVMYLASWKHEQYVVQEVNVHSIKEAAVYVQEGSKIRKRARFTETSGYFLTRLGAYEKLEEVLNSEVKFTKQHLTHLASWLWHVQSATRALRSTP